MQAWFPIFVKDFTVWTHTFYGNLRIGKLQEPLLPEKNTNIVGFDIPHTEGVSQYLSSCDQM